MMQSLQRDGMFGRNSLYSVDDALVFVVKEKKKRRMKRKRRRMMKQESLELLVPVYSDDLKEKLLR